ncbi:hypothetical protein KM043_010888 [Ampulex compressa]|nr:hypothetical protein KM043_010888 [Ampulex compressa]
MQGEREVGEASRIKSFEVRRESTSMDSSYEDLFVRSDKCTVTWHSPLCSISLSSVSLRAIGRPTAWNFLSVGRLKIPNPRRSFDQACALFYSNVNEISIAPSGHNAETVSTLGYEGPRPVV